MRRIAVMLMALGVLTGCTPGPSPIAALHLGADGRVKLLYGLCEGEQPRSASLAPGSGGGTWTVLALDGKPAAELTLLEKAPGWEQTSAELDALGPGRYFLEVTTGGYRGNQRRNARFDFTLDGLRGLADGQVLAADADGKATPMTRGEFAERARESC
ncbi:hypothetical protein ACIBG8_06835 [Nonomuraea sp. NPDC050556]|uniref:hypothetical protein n=1 Tax=Nonomuraea sp. NPDC050556 TaxID=3364369 RepID=UPI0037A5A153